MRNNSDGPWEAIPLKWEVKIPVEDQPQRQQWNDRSELERRLLAQICEHCRATRLTETLEVHHIRALKDLDRYDGREKPGWVKIMAARRRKTLFEHSFKAGQQHSLSLPLAEVMTMLQGG